MAVETHPKQNSPQKDGQVSVTAPKETIIRASGQRNGMNNKPNYEVRVGLFFLTAVCMLTSGWSWLKSASLLHQPQRFVVTFKDVAGLNNNAPVNINGVRVGQVEQIDLKGRGQVNVHLKISSEDLVIPHGSLITIQTIGLVGAKYIEITLPDESTKQADILPGETVPGQDPVRLELVANKIATKLNNMINTVGSEDVGPSLAEALRHSGEAVNNINDAAKKLNKNMDKLGTATESFTQTSNKIGVLADEVKGTGSSAKHFFSEASILASDLKKTSGSLNKIIANPHLSGDLKETAQLARDTATKLGATVKEMNESLRDPAIRADVNAMLVKLNHSTDNVRTSIEKAEGIAKDDQLRADVMQATGNLKDSLNKLNNIVQEPGFKEDLRATMARVKTAATNVDTAALQLKQVLDKPQPLLRMMFGRPGHLEKPENQDGTGKSQKSQTGMANKNEVETK
jgi:phospholipid/cholesterol/gamma-HCH transport system substrate-binding protein